MLRFLSSQTVSACLLVSVFALAPFLAKPFVRGANPGPAESEFFEKEVRPLLAERCFKCHGGEKTKAGLRLTSRASILSGGDSGPAAVPEKPEQSLMIQAIKQEGDLKMPPNGRLTSRQVDKLARWIKMGLPWPDTRPEQATASNKEGQEYEFTAEQRRFWAFQPVKKMGPPVVRNLTWPRSEIDRFILANLESRRLRPANPADKPTLIRRATFDLTGLPPTPQEIEAFLSDQSPEAFARVVDRLLASPHYGERWGRHWLDVVRYTDSFDARILAGAGTIMDITEAYRYRDWVVDALNRDEPYDQFIIDQIAGDMVPAKEHGEINIPGTIATGMLAVGNWGGGDADKEKLLTDIADDQIDVVGRAFLGLTIACARCHDHKFDPIPTEDYYGLAGIFFSTHILEDPGPKTNGPPMLRIPLASRSELNRREQIKQKIARLERELNRLRDELRVGEIKKRLTETARYLVAAWECQIRTSDDAAVSSTASDLAQFASRRRLDEQILRQWLDYLGFGEARLLDRPVRDLLGNVGVHGLRVEADTPSLVVNSTDKPVAFLTIKLPPRCVAIHPSPKGGVAVAWKSPITGSVRISGRVADADDVCGDGVAWRLQQRRGKNTKELAAGDIPNGGSQRLVEVKGANQLTSVEVKSGDSILLEVLPKLNHACDTTVVDLEITEAGPQRGVWNLTKDVVPDLHQAGRGNPHSDRYGNRAVWYFYDTGAGRQRRGAGPPGSALARWYEAVDKAAIRQDAWQTVAMLAREVQRALDDPAVLKGLSAAFYRELLSPLSPFWTSDVRDLPPEGRATLAKWTAELEALRKNPPPPISIANGAQEGGCPLSPQVGVHDVRVHIRGRYDRLGKLVPRHFPRIIAGEEQPPITQGSGRLQLAQWVASPKNPLTARVMANRIWQLHFGEGIVRTSGNFGKLGRPPTHPELLDYLARYFIESGWSMKAMHRAIMLSSAYQQSSVPQKETFEADPDNNLFGRMNRRRLEAEEIRDALLAVSGQLNPEMGGRASQDFNLPRRTLYLMTIRSDRSSFRELFDAADPTAVTDRRIVSTVAPQALFLLNNAFTIEQTKTLARRIVEVGPKDDIGKIRRAYALLLGRPALDEEITVGISLLERARGSRGPGDSAATNLLAWEEYCQVMLCLNEFVYVD